EPNKSIRAGPSASCLQCRVSLADRAIAPWCSKGGIRRCLCPAMVPSTPRTAGDMSACSRSSRSRRSGNGRGGNGRRRTGCCKMGRRQQRRAGKGVARTTLMAGSFTRQLLLLGCLLAMGKGAVLAATVPHSSHRATGTDSSSVRQPRYGQTGGLMSRQTRGTQPATAAAPGAPRPRHPVASGGDDRRSVTAVNHGLLPSPAPPPGRAGVRRPGEGLDEENEGDENDRGIYGGGSRRQRGMVGDGTKSPGGTHRGLHVYEEKGEVRGRVSAGDIPAAPVAGTAAVASTAAGQEVGTTPADSRATRAPWAPWAAAAEAGVARTGATAVTTTRGSGEGRVVRMQEPTTPADGQSRRGGGGGGGAHELASPVIRDTGGERAYRAKARVATGRGSEGETRWAVAAAGAAATVTDAAIPAWGSRGVARQAGRRLIGDRGRFEDSREREEGWKDWQEDDEEEGEGEGEDGSGELPHASLRGGAPPAPPSPLPPASHPPKHLPHGVTFRSLGSREAAAEAGGQGGGGGGRVEAAARSMEETWQRERRSGRVTAGVDQEEGEEEKKEAKEEDERRQQQQAQQPRATGAAKGGLAAGDGASRMEAQGPGVSAEEIDGVSEGDAAAFAAEGAMLGTADRRGSTAEIASAAAVAAAGLPGEEGREREYFQARRRTLVASGGAEGWVGLPGRERLERQQHRQQQEQLSPARARSSRALADEVLETIDGVELECTLTVPGDGVAGGGPAIDEPQEDAVLVHGTLANVSWSLDLFEEGSAAADDESTGISSSASLVQAVDVGKVNVTFFNGAEDVWRFDNISNTGEFSWIVDPELEQALTYRVAVWDTASRICAISNEFGVSSELSITVTQFEGINEEGMVDISPLRKGDNASSEGGGEIYSCGGSVGVEWSFTGLLETVSVRVCQEQDSSGTLAGLEDDDLLNPGSVTTETGEPFLCLDPVSDDVAANLSSLTAPLTAEDGITTTTTTTTSKTCGVWGTGFYAKVSWAESGQVYGLSSEGGGTVPVLGGVFIQPNDTTTTMSISESQSISWEGRTGVGESATVDIILRSKGNLSEDAFYIVAEGDERTSVNGAFTWSEPSAVFTEEDLASSEIFDGTFYLEVYDAVGGGLICRSLEFELEPGEPSSDSDPSTLLLLLTPAALLLLCCCGIFFVACPYYDKIVRRRRQELGPSLIDVDDTYIIDGEGQPAILALDSHVIPLAHAHVWPMDGANSLNASHSGSSSYVIRQVPPGNGNGGGRGGGNSPSWARAVLTMGHSVTESIGRAAGLAI
ncbi:unnamed protein product, partial [Scytosiphon promiscuus]